MLSVGYICLVSIHFGFKKSSIGSMYLISRYNLKGPKAGTLEVINDNLPGLPDNIRPSSSGGYWVGLALTRVQGRFSIMDFCAEKPWLRSLVMKVRLAVQKNMVMKFDYEGTTRENKS